MRFTFILSALIGLAIASYGQTVNRCATHDIYLHNTQQYPGYDQLVKQTFENAKAMGAAANKQGSSYDTVYRIPVVVHVVYKTAAQNVPDSVIRSQIAVLNRDYRRRNADTTDTRDTFKVVAGDAGIEFYLADTDPNGNATDGITRTETAKDFFALDLFGGGIGMDGVKYDSTGGKNAWDVERYLNIWVCNTEDPNGFFGVVLGFAYPPVGAPNWPAGSSAPQPGMAGVVINFKVMGGNNTLSTGQFATADEGRTAVHEVGHYLGLRHIWGDANTFLGENGCLVDDGIQDTPNAADASQQTCNLNKNTCSDTPYDFKDMIENYMDYSDEACMNTFTQGQIDIMRAMLSTARTGLPFYGADVNVPVVAETGDFIWINGVALSVAADTFITFAAGDTLSYIDDNGDTVEVVNNTSNDFGIDNGDELLASGNSFFVNDQQAGAVVIQQEPIGIAELSNALNMTLAPNPFKGSTSLKYTLTEASNVDLKVYDLVGQRVWSSAAAEQKSAGEHKATIDMTGNASGIYFIRLTVNGIATVKKISVL